jgi:sugar/nucleoside kinase (ribokinase family)
MSANYTKDTGQVPDDSKNQTSRNDGLISGGSFSYAGMIGTGGVGTGDYFRLNGDHTLGREESRSGRFLDRRDYCKLHIISHYTKALLGSGFEVYPIGKVGDDPAGKRLLEEMREYGLNLRFIESLQDKPTLYSFCFLYPDGSGGNLTTDNSASTEVDEAAITGAVDKMAELGPRGIALAAPEVPLPARLKLLALAGEYGLYRVASFTGEEIPEIRELDLGSLTDLLAVNENEGAAFLGDAVEGGDEVIAALSERYPSLAISMTAGAQGSWSWDGSTITNIPAAPVTVETTGGAGDAHLAGIISGTVCGLSLADAQRIGTVIAAASVGSPHTINFSVTKQELTRIASMSKDLSPVQELFA